MLLALLHALPPETAHNLAILGLRHQLAPKVAVREYANLACRLWGRDFHNPVGLAAGFDKDAACIPALLRYGLGFIEVGTVTVLPQQGNPKPRLFRLSEDGAIINRMGFNNQGMEGFVTRLATPRQGMVGANIGKNKTSTDPVADYTTLLKAVYPYSDYITVNISSPNTPGLRALQGKDELDVLLNALMRERSLLVEAYSKTVPLLVKIAPDITIEAAEDIVTIARKYRLDGLIVSNTTIAGRDILQSPYKHETGGLSGKPLFALSTQLLKDIYRLTQGEIPLIGVGGVASGADAYAKIRAGASLVQLYSALIYEGFELVERVKQELSTLLVRDGFQQVSDAVGADMR